MIVIMPSAIIPLLIGGYYLIPTWLARQNSNVDTIEHNDAVQLSSPANQAAAAAENVETENQVATSKDTLESSPLIYVPVP